MSPKGFFFLKLAGVVLIAILGIGVFFYAQRTIKYEQQYSRLEQQRAEQALVAPAPPPASPSPVPTPADYWTDFRGPSRDGNYAERAIRTDWTPDMKPIWRQPVGGGYASFSIGGGRAYTIEQRRNNEVVAAYDIDTGRELWTNSWAAEFRESMGGDGPRATPTFHEGRVYALGAEGELRVLDAATGTQIWRKNILSEANARNIQWGMAASPLVIDDKLIVQPGGRGASIVA